VIRPGSTPLAALLAILVVAAPIRPGRRDQLRGGRLARQLRLRPLRGRGAVRPPGLRSSVCLMGFLLATSMFARGAASQGTVRYQSTDGTFVTIPETEQRSRINDLQGLLNNVEGGRDVLFSTGEKTIVLDTGRLDKIALWLVANGGLTPGQIGDWKADQIAASKRAAEKLKAELAALRGATTIATPTTAAAEPPSGDPLAVSFPEPMDWRGARGMIIGVYSLACGEWRGTTYTAGPNEAGRWGIIFQGDGTMRAGFKPSPPPHDVPHADWVSGNDTQWISGSIDNDRQFGNAGGRGPVRGGELRWSISVERPPAFENRIRAYKSEVSVVMDAENGRTCRQEYFSQIEPQ